MNETLEEEDRLSDLPDCLIVSILSLLPSTKEAIRTSTLSKRWESLWTVIPTLVFRQDPSTYRQGERFILDFALFVHTTLAQCFNVKLNKFHVLIHYSDPFQSLINNWIQYAVGRNVEELSVLLVSTFKDKCVLEEQFFVNSRVTVLRLGDFILMPNGAISWKRLRTLCIVRVCVDEDLIENILLGSPVLETLEMNDCYGYKRLDITSKSVKNLVFCGYRNLDSDDVVDIIEINAPYILSFKILDDLYLWKILLQDLSSLAEAELDYVKSGLYDTSTVQHKEDTLKGFIESLRHVKELKVGLYCAKPLYRLEAQGFSFPSNMEFPDVTPSCLSDESESISSLDESSSDDLIDFEQHPSDGAND